MTSVLGVIPSRYASTRFPGKPLALLRGKPMVEWVYAAAKRALPRVVVATDDARIERAVRAFGGEAVRTSKRCRSGTDRVGEVARKIRARVFVNIQGDEPLMPSAAIRKVAELSLGGRFDMATAATRGMSLEEWKRPDIVKAIVDKNGRALYFSRAALPFHRDGEPKAPPSSVGRHMGLYGYTASSLKKFLKAPVSEWETAESLEQLRALEAGLSIGVAWVKGVSIGVDRPEDLAEAERRMAGA